MLRRKAIERMRFWKQNKTRQALLVTGTRQVGKTYLVRRFARETYPVLVEFNLLEDATARESFKAARSAEDLLLRISVATSTRLETGRTLIFLDEVQECPEIVTYIKFLVDRGDFDYVLSGSLLGVELEGIRSYPIGYLTELRMYPLDFEEFCWAHGLGEPQMQLAFAAFAAREPVPDYLHERLLGLFHRYLAIGGMPDAVVAYLESGSIDQVRIIQDGIVAFYERDISKYAPRDRRLVIKDIYRLIPSELSSQNRRFRLSSIPDVKRYAQVRDEFLWLTKANVALATYNVKAPISPLLLNEAHNVFKLFYSDVGLLTSRFPKRAILGLLDGRPEKQMGGTYENFVAQELAAHGFDLHYLTKRKVGEIDFIVEGRDGKIMALEIKSGRGYRTHTALLNALATPGYQIDSAYVFAESNVERNGDVLYLPVYLVSALRNE